MKKIMVVDDSESMRKLVSFTLEDSGFEVLTAKNGKEALDVLQDTHEIPLSMIITDLNMPIMNGIEFIKELRTSDGYRYTPIIMLTTESQETKRQEGKNAGASGWMLKPFTPANLLCIVEELSR